MRPKFSQAFYLRAAALLWFLIALGSCFSLGFRFHSYDPGEIVAKTAYILLFFLTCYFFIWLARKAQEQEFDLPSDAEAEKIIKEFEITNKRKK